MIKRMKKKNLKMRREEEVMDFQTKWSRRCDYKKRTKKNKRLH